MNSLEFDITVRGTEIEFSPTAVTLNDMIGDNGGVISMVAPQGQTWSQFEIPTSAAAYMTVEGLGTEQIHLIFQEGVMRQGAEIECDYSLAGAVSGMNVVNVQDLVHNADDVVANYDISLD